MVNLVRTVFIYGDYFWEFYNRQSIDVQEKIDWVISLIQTVSIVPEKFLKHLNGSDGLYEIRVQLGSNIFRIFCFFDEQKLIILLNGFQKKSKKTPIREIEKAELLKKQYHANKKQ